MSVKISDLSDQLGLSQKELKEKISELGFEISPRARVLDDETAELIKSELLSSDADSVVEIDSEEVSEVAEVYDEMIAQEREREIIKSQRKKTAGRFDGVKKSHVAEQDKAVVDSVEIPDFISVKEFSEKTGVKIAKIIGELMKNGILANINQQIDFETAQVIADDMGIKLKRLRSAADAEELLAGDLTNLLKEDDTDALEVRPPVVCIMGHVDHGKTQLLDTIRSANVVSGEAGGITQHIGAYQVNRDGKLITFLDTPGHEAFTEMRARGAKVTDIAILVVAADEGVKPQTLEALNHARDAGVPIIVAINKIDKPAANPERVMGELAENGLSPESWGGDTIMVPVSALKGDGIENLLDMILLSAEMLNLKANPNREAVGTVVEAHLDKNLGPVATILINTGTLKIMNNIVVGSSYGRVKVMRDHNAKSLRLAKPSMPVLIAGLNVTPRSGDILQVMRTEKEARDKAAEVLLLTEAKSGSKSSGVGQLLSSIAANKVMKLIIKADAKGSLEAIKSSLAKIKDDEVAIKIIHSGLGTVTESDVMMASASNGMVAAFHCDYYSPTVKKIVERDGIEVRFYKVIYDLIEDVKQFLSGLIEPEMIEVALGRAEVKKVFLRGKKELILGCRVLSGKLENKAKVRIIRGRTAEDEDNVVGNGTLSSLRKVDEVVNEVSEGNECGVKFTGDLVVQDGDVLFAYKEVEQQRTLK